MVSAKIITHFNYSAKKQTKTLKTHSEPDFCFISDRFIESLPVRYSYRTQHRPDGETITAQCEPHIRATSGLV